MNLKQRQKTGNGRGLSTLKAGPQAPNDVLPPARPPLLTLPKTVPAAEVQEFNA